MRLWDDRPAWAGLLAPLAWGYALGVWLLRSIRRARPWRPPVPVVSVGNLSVGGTGKSPLVHAVAALGRRAGLRPAVLLRGYRAAPGARPLMVSRGRGPLVGVAASGDEAQEHAVQTGAQVWIDPDRASAARAAVQAGADLLVLDDGFQRRWQLHRDLDLLLADWGQLQAGERLLPWGPWREPWSQARFADAFLVSGAPQGLDARGIARRLPPLWRGKPVFRLDLRPRRLRDWPKGRALPLARLKGLRVAALSGLGRPARFEAALAALGAQVLPWRFRDHHAFSAADLAQAPSGAEALVCTRKDAMRLPRGFRPPLPLWVLEAEAQVSPSAPFQRLVRSAWRGPKR